MNGKLLISLCTSLLLASGAGAAWAQEVDCTPIPKKDKDTECQGSRTYPLVTINTVTKKLSPEWVCADRGSVIEFRVVPPGKTESDSVDVKAKAKDESNTWLIGANYPDKTKIEVRVPMWVKSDTIHDYNIFFKDGTCVDPRVHVKN